MLSGFRQHFFLTVAEQNTYINKFGICHLSIIPVRAEPTSKSEQVTQLLFGETYQVTQLSLNGKFVWITTDYDQYSGWVEASRWYEISESFYLKAQEDQHLMIDQPFGLLMKPLSRMQLSFGSTLPTETKGELHWEGETMFCSTERREIRNQADRSQITLLSFMFLGTPYLWGGKSIFGIDCSGFTQLVFKAGGYFLPRDAYQQEQLGSSVANLSEAKGGDLVFFAREGNIIHVGIVLTISDIHQIDVSYAQALEKTLGEFKEEALKTLPVLSKPYQWIMHAYDCVRIDILDQVGIYNLNEKQYTHYTHSIKQVLDLPNRYS